MITYEKVQIDGYTLQVAFALAPIPYRGWDYEAVEEHLADDMAWDDDGFYYFPHPVGYGSTRDEAINNVLDRLKDRDHVNAEDNQGSQTVTDNTGM